MVKNCFKKFFLINLVFESSPKLNQFILVTHKHTPNLSTKFRLNPRKFFFWDILLTDRRVKIWPPPTFGGVGNNQPLMSGFLQTIHWFPNIFVSDEKFEIAFTSRPKWHLLDFVPKWQNGTKWQKKPTCWTIKQNDGEHAFDVKPPQKPGFVRSCQAAYDWWWIRYIAGRSSGAYSSTTHQKALVTQVPVATLGLGTTALNHAVFQRAALYCQWSLINN